jgi:hypothetical protein
MRYTVVWTDAAVNALAPLWTTAANRNAVQQAADQIDPELSVDPHQKGTDFYGDRLLVIPPLSVVFSISDADRMVTALIIWWERLGNAPPFRQARRQ